MDTQSPAIAFDTLPDLIPIALVSLICNLSISTIYLLRRREKFPAPVVISPKKRLWRKSDVLEYLQDK